MNITLAAAKRLFSVGDVVDVTNHYITRADHPCFGTNRRRVVAVSSHGITFGSSGHVPWPKAAQVALADDGALVLYGGGCAQQPGDLFLTIRRAA